MRRTMQNVNFDYSPPPPFIVYTLEFFVPVFLQTTVGYMSSLGLSVLLWFACVKKI